MACHLTEVGVLLNLQLGEEVVSLLEFRCIIGREAIFWYLQGVLCLVPRQHKVVAISSLDSTSNSEDTRPIIHANHQVVDLLQLVDTWHSHLIAWCLAEMLILCLLDTLTLLYIVGWCSQIAIVVKFDADFVGVDIDVLRPMVFRFIPRYLLGPFIVARWRVFSHVIIFFLYNLMWLNKRSSRSLQGCILRHLQTCSSSDGLLELFKRFLWETTAMARFINERVVILRYLWGSHCATIVKIWWVPLRQSMWILIHLFDAAEAHTTALVKELDLR